MAVPSALVLGGGGGIGAAVSRRLAATHAVMVGCWKDLDRAKRLVDGLAAEGSTAQVIQSDATSEAGAGGGLRRAGGGGGGGGGGTPGSPPPRQGPPFAPRRPLRGGGGFGGGGGPGGGGGGGGGFPPWG